MGSVHRQCDIVGVVDSSVVCALQTYVTKAMEHDGWCPRDERLTTRLRSATA